MTERGKERSFSRPSSRLERDATNLLASVLIIPAAAQALPVDQLDGSVPLRPRMMSAGVEETKMVRTRRDERKMENERTLPKSRISVEVLSVESALVECVRHHSSVGSLGSIVGELWKRRREKLARRVEKG